MSTPKIVGTIQAIFQPVDRMIRLLIKGLMGWLLRGLLAVGRQAWSQAGFVLPTTVLLLLVVTLTVGAIGYRTFTRTQDAMGARQQQIIYNAATPAIDRAKAKLEFMFDSERDPRGGDAAPPTNVLLGMMLNDGSNGVPKHPTTILNASLDPYTLPGETRLDITADSKKDNAWRYEIDTNGDSTSEATVVYSISFSTPSEANLRNNTDTAIAVRADALQVRNAPLSNATKPDTACQTGTGTAPVIRGDGWFPDVSDANTLRKNFQIDAYVVPKTANGGSVATLEMQQDRQSSLGFKWAAWFRNDIELSPGSRFNWNGAMHTEGSLFVNSSNINGYLISSPNSCLFRKEASQITASGPGENAGSIFQGQFIAGSALDNTFSGSGPKFDLWNGGNAPSSTNNTLSVAMGSTTDSVTLSGANASKTVADFLLDPIILQTQGISKARGFDSIASARDPNWATRNFRTSGRIFNEAQDAPYVDDSFRADNRYGPKPIVGRGPSRTYVTDQNYGQKITGKPDLVRESPPGLDSTDLGLDGYWERRARYQGLRLIVGQRLELGDPAGWGNDPSLWNGTDARDDASKNEPLRPYRSCRGNARCVEARQRKTLWDNLAAVQATAVYHAKATNVDYPTACLATTVHPGTAGTLDRSATFEDLAYGLPTTAFPNFLPSTSTDRAIVSDFFRGRGTNGWQFSMPPESVFTSLTSPLTVDDSSPPLIKALNNLASFAGDPQGGTPSFPPTQGSGTSGYVHPFPSMAMWGDFSMLRRVLQLLKDGDSTYTALSPADKTTLHTAACTLGLLAYNLEYLEKFDWNTVDASLIGYAASPPANTRPGLRGYIRKLLTVAGVPSVTPATTTDDVPAFIKTYVNPQAKLDTLVLQEGQANNPETFVRLLEMWRDSIPDNTSSYTLETALTNAQKRDELSKVINLARLIVTREQMERDRRFGFYGSYKDITGAFSGSFDSTDTARAFPSVGWCNSWGRTDALGYLCSSRPRYPILYSLFPAVDKVAPSAINPTSPNVPDYAGLEGHKELGAFGGGDIATNTRDVFDRDNQESVFRDLNAGVVYRVVNPADIALRPLKLGGLGTSGNWTVPTVAHTAGTTPNSSTLNLIKVCTTPCAQYDPSITSNTRNRAHKSGDRYRIPFKDAGFYNGRELMNVRTLDLDLDLMRTSQYGTDDYWLPNSGLIYAYREDALSEAHIVRPTVATNWTNCDTFTEMMGLTSGTLTNPSCHMKLNTNAYDSKDPPNNSSTLITPKPVDFYPDPDRRPNGFRLRNGASVWRQQSAQEGLSFISDNPVYIQGDFNLHRPWGETSTGRDKRLEEFAPPNDQLPDDWSNFYSRSNRDSSFARPLADQWRPVEILADAITILSNNFCDGSIEDGLITMGTTPTAATIQGVKGSTTYVSTRYGCPSGSSGRTSYINQTRPNADPTTISSLKNGVLWMRATGADSYLRANAPARPTSGSTAQSDWDTAMALLEGDSPIVIHTNGDPALQDGTVYASTYELRDNNNRRDAILVGTDMQVNAVLINGVVPSQALQYAGGLHNFPRFIENWQGSRKLYIAGAFLQLNFSTYGTGTFDQDTWDPGEAPVSREVIFYYIQPVRLWGYDVALQYAPPGPVAQRFKIPEGIRSEFYTEPALDDPYIDNLKTCVTGCT